MKRKKLNVSKATKHLFVPHAASHVDLVADCRVRVNFLCDSVKHYAQNGQQVHNCTSDVDNYNVLYCFFLCEGKQTASGNVVLLGNVYKFSCRTRDASLIYTDSCNENPVYVLCIV